MENRVGLIYKATDKVLNKSYIGQTLGTLENRKKQHLKHATEKLDRTYFTTFYKMIRIIGQDSFEWTVLEENIPQSQLNEKERYYISEYDTYENGYNEGPGGQLSHSSVLKEEQVSEIIEILKNSEDSMNKIAEKFGVTRSIISDINCGDTWYNANISYPIREQGFNKKINFSQEQITDILDLLKNTKTTYRDIAKKYNCNAVSIVKINDGIHYRQSNVTYPIRKKAYTHVDKETIRKVVNALLTTDTPQMEIAAKLGIKNRKVVSTINMGKYHSEIVKELFPDITFPIR